MKKELKKYWSIVQISFQNSLNYRGEMFLWLIIDAMPLLAMLVLWISVYSHNENIAGFNLQTMLLYYLSGYLISGLIGVHFEEDWLEQIRQGRVSCDLLKPFSIKKLAVLGELSWKIMSFFFTSLPIIMIFIFLFGNLFYTPSLVQILVIILFILLGFILDSLFSLAIMAGGFLFDQARSLSHLKWMLGWLFSGSMLPFEVLPNWLSNVARLLPFQFLYYVPVNVYLGRLESPSYSKLIMLEMVWLIVLYLMLRKFWKFSLKKFTAVGN